MIITSKMLAEIQRGIREPKVGSRLSKDTHKTVLA
jgi:hypothetical protein